MAVIGFLAVAVQMTVRKEDFFHENICKGIHDGEKRLIVTGHHLFRHFCHLSCFAVSDCHSPLSFVQHFALIPVWLKANQAVCTHGISVVCIVTKNNMDFHVARVIRDHRTDDVSAEDTALLGFGSDPFFSCDGDQTSGSSRSIARTPLIGAYVKNISWSECGVAGSSHGDRELRAKRTILTTSFGVLQS